MFLVCDFPHYLNFIPAKLTQKLEVLKTNKNNKMFQKLEFQIPISRL